MAWEIESRGIKDEMLKEPGPNGRWLFRIQEMPGLGRDAVPIRHTIMAAPDMLAALKQAESDQMAYVDRLYRDGPRMAGSLAEARARLAATRAAIAKAEGAA
jgi:hypothetical protein